MKRILLLITCCWTLAVGCKKEEIPLYVAPDSSYGLIYEKVFSVSCALSACHDNGSDANSPILLGESTYGELINGAVHNDQAIAAGLVLVKPFDPDSSFLYQKLIADSNALAFGSAMPAGGLTLTTNQIDFVRQWILAGAPLNGHVVDKTLLD